MSRKVIQQFGGWSVTKAGSVFHKQMQYWIYDNRVNERDWEEHISKNIGEKLKILRRRSNWLD